MENQKPKKEIVGNPSFNELRDELSKYYQYERVLDDVVLLFREAARRKGEKTSIREVEKTIVRFWTEWESFGSPMGYNRGEQIKKNKETGKVFAIVEYDDREGITLRTHLSWFFLLCSLYEEYRWSRKRAEELQA